LSVVETGLVAGLLGTRCVTGAVAVVTTLVTGAVACATTVDVVVVAVLTVLATGADGVVAVLTVLVTGAAAVLTVLATGAGGGLGAATGAVAELMLDVAEETGATGVGAAAMARSGTAAAITSSDVAAAAVRNRFRRSPTSLE
jgi:hypothetical protein